MCAKIFEVSDASQTLDIKVLFLLLGTFAVRGDLKMFLELARYDLVKSFFKLLINLRERVLADEQEPTAVFDNILSVLNAFLKYKRLRKILRNTANFDVISQPSFCEQIFFINSDPCLCVHALWFSAQIPNRKSFSRNFVKRYIGRVWEILPLVEAKMDALTADMIQLISHKILESEQGSFFLNSVALLPEKSKIITENWEFLKWKYELTEFSEPICGLVKCRNCDNMESSQKEFEKCSRCKLVFYCSKACQKADWPIHKKLCKKIQT